MTILATPDAQLFRATLDDVLNVITIQDSRQGYVGWRVDCVAGEFDGTSETTDIRFGEKNRSAVRDIDWNNGSNTYRLRFAGDDLVAVVVTVDQGQPSEASFFVGSGSGPLEILGDL